MACNCSAVDIEGAGKRVCETFDHEEEQVDEVLGHFIGAMIVGWVVSSLVVVWVGG